MKQVLALTNFLIKSRNYQSTYTAKMYCGTYHRMKIPQVTGASVLLVLLSIKWNIQKIVVAMETERRISKFFTFVFITQYKLKLGKVSKKSIFSISKAYWKVSDFLRERLLKPFKILPFRY